MERRSNSFEPRFTLLWRLFQSEDDVPQELPLQPTRYTTSIRHFAVYQQGGTLTSAMTDFKFIRPLYHPNIYPDGRLCISILHAPGEDEMSGESAAERWSPAQRVESVLISILSLLDDAEVSSPANVDAGVMLRKEPEKYKERVKEDTEKSKDDIPVGFTMPTADKAFKGQEEQKVSEDYWYDSDAGEDDFDFGGSDSDVDEDMEVDDATDEEDDEEEEAEKGHGE